MASFSSSLLAGGTAGLFTDIVLYPLDTVKTRLQSGKGFINAGGFKGIYSGLGSVSIGSIPSAALFFGTYDFIKRLAIDENTSRSKAAAVHLMAASLGEIFACIARVPMEVVKQRTQTSQKQSSLTVLKSTIKAEGFRGLYRGYLSTVLKDIPFSLIQFPIWEFLKFSWSKESGRSIEPWQSAICGAISGGLAAAVTTPLDVAKTRIMLANSGSNFAAGKVLPVMLEIWRQSGHKGLFAGIVPRVTAIALGGAIFLGIYEKTMYLVRNF